MRPSAWISTWSVVVGLCLLAAASAGAQEAPPSPGAAPAPAPSPPPQGDPAAVARERFKRGEAAYQKGSYALAIEEWQAAYAADPRPRIQYNIYQAYERLGQLQEASTALQRYLSTADPDDPYYSDATARMAALQQRLQATGIRLVGGIDGASINVSGHDWGRLPRPDRIPVQPGNHRVVITLPGYRDFVANVVVPGGQVVDVMVQLDPLADAPPGQSGPAAAPGASAGVGVQLPARDEPAGGTPFFIAAGVLGAGAIGSGIWMFNRISELDGCDDAASFCPEEDAVSTQRNIAIGLTAVLGAGAIGALIYGLVVDGESNSPSAAMCVPTGVGAHCRVAF